MGKETKYTMYDEADIIKMGAMIREVQAKLREAIDIQAELSFMLYAVRKDSNKMVWKTHSIHGAEPAYMYTSRVEGGEPPSKLIKTNVDGKRKYSFCKSADTTMWHIRRMADGGRTPSSTRSLCDEQVFWNGYFHRLVTVTEDNMDNVCMQCVVKYRREQGEQYVNR